MSQIKFTINGTEHTVSNNIRPDTSLNSYLRNHANLRGTKSMCQEGGCGACIVSVAAMHPVTNKPEIFAVNSCLVSIMSCHGWAITTIEKIGNKHTGYHPIQKRLAAFNGTQCGFCSPGWVMNMYSLVESNKEGLSMKDVENSFAGNMCRCTGYRPILDAFKSFSNDCDPSIAKQVQDIEELSGINMCAKSGLICTKSCNDYSAENGACNIKMERPITDSVVDKTTIEIDFPDCKWFKVYELNEIFNIFEKYKGENYMLVAGNTAQGVYPVAKSPKIMIDISNISELRNYEVATDLILGANITLKDAMDVFQQVSKTNKRFEYTSEIYKHMDLIAHIPVRNVGTIAGNLSIKHKSHGFQSDVFVLLETIGATLTIVEKGGVQKIVTLQQYLSLDMNHRIIFKINMPPLNEDYILKTYKIMPRSQNSHAHINAGFLLLFNDNKTVVEKASIVYGGINPEFIHAASTEKYILGKNIFDKVILKEAFNVLSNEINPDEAPPEPSPEYRKKLAVNLFYKYILKISPSNLFDSKEMSGGIDFVRPVSSGKQDFDTNKDNWPLNKPVSKVEALVQCSGEAKFVNDISSMPGELYATFVLSTVYSGTVDNIDATEAKMMKGVVALFTAADIPGKNTFSPFDKYSEEILCSEKVLYCGQPLAIIVAETEKLANAAADMIKVSYKDVAKSAPVLNVRQALKSKDVTDRLVSMKTVEPQEKGTDVTKVIKGSYDFFGQYHYTMETQSCVCVPAEDGLDIYPASQWMDLIQNVVSKSLNIPENRINIHVRRLGGGYGGKITRTAQIAAACALAAVKLNRPVRFIMSLKQNMLAVGKRVPYASDYEVGVNDEGKIQYLINKYYADDGCSHNDSVAEYALHSIINCYDSKTWSLESNAILTDTAANTACRAPGTTEGVAMIENIMEHIATVTKKDPLDVRMVNMDMKDNPLPELINNLKESADFEKRSKDVKQFNSKNIWRKRGISLVPLKYSLHHWGNFSSMVSIYHDDGTVAISHAGIEMGQGINTKVAQVAAHVLGISLDKVCIKPSNNFTAPNAIVSGGSITSEVCCFATIKACQILLDRLEPIKKEMENPTWEDLVQKAHASQVDLCAHHMFSNKDGLVPYTIWAVAIAEVEVDILTGNHQVLRVDIIEDTGESLSPQIDVGQVEGAFIMGLGYWTSENLVYDSNTGELLTNRTWNYKPPGVKDIPIDFRVSFRRNAPNPAGVLRSKATGEPPLNMSIVIVFAMRQAIMSAKTDNGCPENEWLQMTMPCTPENVMLSANIDVMKN